MEREVSFGAWLRRRRRALDLTQDALADRIGCSPATIRKIESDERRPSKQIAALLAQHLQIPPEEQANFFKVARGERMVERLTTAAPPPPPLPRPRSASPAVERGYDTATPPNAVAPATLPQLPTPLIGRVNEMAEVLRILALPDCRLLTIVGPGGVGKTRLALAAAHALTARIAHATLADPPSLRFVDGIYFVTLAALHTPALMAATVADALGFAFSIGHDTEVQLLNYLRAKQLLLVLDNLEHLLGSDPPTADAGAGASLLSAILKQATGVKLLVTSRERLNLQDEWILDLQGLPTPPARQPQQLADYSAVALFVERARRVQTSFTVTEQNQTHVAQICRLVEGIPLGLELAAGWVHLLSCQEIAQEIERNLDFLASGQRDVPPRHRSLRAAIDYSWRLLDGEEQRILCQLAIFRGGFVRTAAATVVGANLGLLARLVTKSLLRRTTTEGDSRYDLQEILRQYCADKLQEQSDLLAQTGDAHSAYFAAFVQGRETELKGAQPLQAIAELNREIDNIRAAWRWAVTHRQLAAIQQPLKSLWFFFEMRGWRQEAAALFAWALQDLALAEQVATSTSNDWVMLCQQIQALYSWFNVCSARLIHAQQVLQESLARLRAQGAGAELAEVLYHIGVLEWMTGDFVTVSTANQRDPASYAEAGAQWGVVRALNLVGQTALDAADYAEARRLFAEAEAAALTAEIWPAAQDARLGLARVLAAEGATVQALDQLAQILNQPATLPETRERAAELRQQWAYHDG